MLCLTQNDGHGRKIFKKETKCQLILSDFVKINAFHGGIGGKTWDEVQI